MTDRALAESRPLVGSSTNNTRGRANNALAIYSNTEKKIINCASTDARRYRETFALAARNSALAFADVAANARACDSLQPDVFQCLPSRSSVVHSKQQQLSHHRRYIATMQREPAGFYCFGRSDQRSMQSTTTQ